MRKYIFFFLSCFMIVNKGFSQEGSPTKITIFKPEDSKPTTSDLPKHVDEHCIKWNYALLGRGVFLINYEHQIQKQFSAEVGFGLTYRDFFFEAFNSSDLGNASYTSSQFGFAVEGGVRWYPRGFDDFEGFYISPMVSYRKYSLSTEDDVNSHIPYINTIAGFKPGYNFTDLQLKFGYQYESLWDWDVLGDFYFGVASRSATINYYNEVHDAITGGTQYVSTQKRKQLPQILCGFKICFPF